MILNQILRGRRKTVVTKSSVLKRKEKKRKKESEKRLFKRYDNQESCQRKWEPNIHKVKQNIYIYIYIKLIQHIFKMLHSRGTSSQSH